MTTPTQRRRTNRKGRKNGIAQLKRTIRDVEKRLKARIADLERELRSSETALAAARLRALNDRQAQEGCATVQSDLKALRDLGIVDESDRRIRSELPAEMSEDIRDVV